MDNVSKVPASEKIVGIIGRMGPETTMDLMQRIIARTVALDQSLQFVALAEEQKVFLLSKI